MKNLIAVLYLLVSMTVSAAEIKLVIVRVFMHTPGDYTVMYAGTDGKSKVIQAERLSETFTQKFMSAWMFEHHRSAWNGTAVTQTLVADVSEDRPMFVHLVGHGSSVDAVIHIHSAQEVSGAEWSSGGKHPRKAITSVVE